MAKRKSPKSKSPVPPQRPQTGPRSASRFVFAYIHPGETSAYFTHSLTGLALMEQGKGRLSNVIQEWSSANVSASRNRIVERFLEQRDADWLLFVDADMAFAPNAFDALFHAADVEKVPVVGGLCYGLADERLSPTLYHTIRDEDDKLTVIRVNEVPEKTLTRVAATGAAFILIHRRVLETVRDRNFNATFPWFQETELHGNPVGEDITFCLRAGMCGIPVYVNTGVQVGHHKSQLLTHELFREQEASTVVDPDSE